MDIQRGKLIVGCGKSTSRSHTYPKNVGTPHIPHMFLIYIHIYIYVLINFIYIYIYIYINFIYIYIDILIIYIYMHNIFMAN